MIEKMDWRKILKIKIDSIYQSSSDVQSIFSSTQSIVFAHIDVINNNFSFGALCCKCDIFTW